jgi:hypothetical protein
VSHSSSQYIDTLQQALQELLRGDRAALKATVSTLVSRLIATEGKDSTTVDWREEVAALTRSAEDTARLMVTTAAEDAEFVGQALLLCAITLELGLRPSAHKLSSLRNLADHSWVLEHSLAHVILVAMNEDEVTRLSWLELLKGLLPQPVQGNQPTDNPRNHPTWGDVFQANRPHASLDPLIAPLTVLLKVDAAFGFSYLESIRDWEFVGHALLLSGSVSTFERWSTALAQASPAFSASGDWTGSVLGLLLMKHAQEELLLCAGDLLFGRSSSEPLWSCEYVVAEVRKRSDWLPMLRCWSVSTFRDYIATADSAPRKHNDRVAHRLSRLERILESMPVEVRQTRPTGELPTAYPAWFVWYERALEVRWHVQSNSSSIPTAQVIALYGQAVTWDSAVCNDVRLHRAQISYGRSELVLGQLDFHLGAAMAAAKQPAKSWDALWQRTFNVREITEFGGYSGDDSEDWQDRSAASSLTELVLRLGLAVADTMLRTSTQPLDKRSSEACSLLCLLQSSAMEMASIEILRADAWTHALRYVLLFWGLCRALAEAVDGNEIPASAREERQLLEYLSTDPTELLLALAACANNGIAEQTIARQLTDARIDFASVLSRATMFSKMSRPRQRLPQECVALAERLCGLMASA